MRPWWAILVSVLLPLSAGLAAQFPPLTGRVVDEAQVLDKTTQQHIENELAAYEARTGIQLVVVSLQSLQGIAIEDYGYQLGRHWGIGQKGKNTGALLIVVPSERETRIEVGYGLEGELTDAASKLIIEQVMIPHFKTGDYAAGIKEGVAAILSVLGGEEVSANSPNRPRQAEEGSPWELLLPFLILFLLFRSFGRRRSGLLAPLILGSMLGGRSTNHWGGSGGFRGGGGSFGGGGASGRW